MFSLRPFLALCSFVGVLMCCQPASAQYREPYDAREIIDSLVNEASARLEDTSQAAFNRLYHRITDSVCYSLVIPYAADLVKKNGYYWPGMIEDGPWDNDTYRYLLRDKYRVSGSSMQTGCIRDVWVDYFDTVMHRMIVQKWGAGFFRRSRREAAALDRRGLGLKLPYAGADTASSRRLLDQSYAWVDTISSPHGMEERHYLLFFFRNGHLAEAVLAENFLGNIQPDFNNGNYNEAILQIAKDLKWHPPVYAGKPADMWVAYDLDGKKLFFVW